MPRISDQIKFCVIYLYRDGASAASGEGGGGSGFLVGVPSQIPGLLFTYAVTNRHVIEGGYTTIRINNQNGGVDFAESGVSHWTFAADSDIAAVLIPTPDSPILKRIPPSMFITKEILEEKKIGMGDDVHLVGRLVLQRQVCPEGLERAFAIQVALAAFLPPKAAPQASRLRLVTRTTSNSSPSPFQRASLTPSS